MVYHSDDKQVDNIDAFITISRYLDDILNVNNIYFDNTVSQIYTIDDFGSLGIYLYTNHHYFNGSHALMLLNHLYIASI